MQKETTFSWFAVTISRRNIMQRDRASCERYYSIMISLICDVLRKRSEEAGTGQGDGDLGQSEETLWRSKADRR